MELKYCPACQQSKLLIEFGIVRRNKDGHRERCRTCYNRKRREQRNTPEYREHANQYQKQYGLTPEGRYHTLKNNRLQSGVLISISRNDFIDWYKTQPKTCYYCSIELVVGGAKTGLASLTLDRKDNDKGYTLDNIVLCCRRCNLMKGDWLTEAQTLEIAKKYFVL